MATCVFSVWHLIFVINVWHFQFNMHFGIWWNSNESIHILIKTIFWLSKKTSISYINNFHLIDKQRDFTQDLKPVFWRNLNFLNLIFIQTNEQKDVILQCWNSVPETKINYISTKQKEMLTQQIWHKFRNSNEKMHWRADQGIDARILKFLNLTGIVI